MKLSPKEKASVLKMREAEQSRLPKMVGYAKEDLYQINDYKKNNWFASKSEKDKIIQDFVDNYIEISVHADNKFECYIEEDQESWYDTESGLFAGMDSNWARTYLKDIKPIKRRGRDVLVREVPEARRRDDGGHGLGADRASPASPSDAAVHADVVACPSDARACSWCKGMETSLREAILTACVRRGIDSKHPRNT